MPCIAINSITDQIDLFPFTCTARLGPQISLSNAQIAGHICFYQTSAFCIVGIFIFVVITGKKNPENVNKIDLSCFFTKQKADSLQ